MDQDQESSRALPCGEPLEEGIHPPGMQLLAQHAPTSSTSSSGSLATVDTTQPTPSRVFYSSAQWTADGTTILVASSDNSVSSFVVPADLLQTSTCPQQLEPRAVTRLPEPTQVVAPAPFFSLEAASTQAFLVACRDHPLHLYHAFPGAHAPAPIGQYKLIKHETEQYLTPSSLVWQYPGTHFICGSANRLDYFDVSRHGSDGPVLTVPTIPSRRHVSKGHGIGMKGTVSALAVSPPDSNGSSLLAAGTWTRWMGLYDLHRSDGAVANWKIAQADIPGSCSGSHGQGIVQVLWSPCGRYLVVNERHADAVLVYDIRGSGKLLSVLTGRTAGTQQRLYGDVFNGCHDGFEVWAGSEDGAVLVWEKVGLTAAETPPSWSWKPHSSPVCSTILHGSGSVVATCSGGWEHAGVDQSVDPSMAVPGRSQGCRVLDESSLKLWFLDEPPAG